MNKDTYSKIEGCMLENGGEKACSRTAFLQYPVFRA